MELGTIFGREARDACAPQGPEGILDGGFLVGHPLNQSLGAIIRTVTRRKRSRDDTRGKVQLGGNLPPFHPDRTGKFVSKAYGDVGKSSLHVKRTESEIKT